MIPKYGTHCEESRIGYSMAYHEMVGRLEGMLTLARDQSISRELKGLKRWAEGKIEEVHAKDEGASD